MQRVSCAFNSGERKREEEEEVMVVGKESGKSHYCRKGVGGFGA